MIKERTPLEVEERTQQEIDERDQETREMVDRLTQFLAITRKQEGVPRSLLERWFWLIVIAGLFGVPILSVGLLWLLSLLMGPRPGVPAEPILEVSDIAALSATHLCPGDNLDFEFEMDVIREGAFELDNSTWKVTPPPQTVIFSEDTERFVIGNPVSFKVVRRWPVPVTYIDPATNTETGWLPGHYQRQVFVTAVGRDAEPSIKLLSFWIREDCPDGQTREDVLRKVPLPSVEEVLDDGG